MVGSAVEVTNMLALVEKYNNNPFIWDTGASFSLAPFRSDSIDYVEADIPVRYVIKVSSFISIGAKNSEDSRCEWPSMLSHMRVLPRSDD